MNNTQISVVIPLYNKEKFIARTLRSVLNQTYDNFELVIIDDGSTDNSINIVESFTDERIEIIKQPNKGVSAARNLGIEKALYNYVAFLDADDEWENTFLEEIVKGISDYPDAIAYCCNYCVSYKNDKCISNVKGVPVNKGIVKNYYLNSIIGSPIITSSSVCLDKKKIKKDIDQLFPKDVKRGEDLDFWTRLYLKHDFYFINKELVTINRVDNSATTNSFQLNDVFNYYKWFRYDTNSIKKRITLYFYALYRITKVYLIKVMNK